MGKLRMDQCKVFENFMKASNLPVVAANYERSCQRKSYRRRVRTSVMIKPGVFMNTMLNQEKFERGGRINRKKTIYRYDDWV